MIDGVTFSDSGDGPQTLLCLHGIGGDASSFHHQLGAFPNTRVIAWNMPGYLGSEIRMNPPDFQHLSERLAAFINAIGDKLHIVGHSIGGMLAIEHAIRHSEQVASMTLIGTTPRFGGRDDIFKKTFLADRLDALDQGQTMADMANETAPKLFGHDGTAEEVAHVARALANVPETTWRGILKCLVTFDRTDDLGNITVPSLIIAGGEDRNAPPKTMKKMAQTLPNARFHVIEGAGHMVHQEAPEFVNGLIQNFLSRLPKT